MARSIRRTWAALAVACVLLPSPAALAVEGAPCPDGSANAVPVDVMALAMAGALKVEPPSVTIHLKATAGANRVCWVAVGLLEGYKVQIQGEDGPFPKLRGWLTHDQPAASSGPPVQPGTWSYRAILHRPNADPVPVEGLSVIIQP